VRKSLVNLLRGERRALGLEADTLRPGASYPAVQRRDVVGYQVEPAARWRLRVPPLEPRRPSGQASLRINDAAQRNTKHDARLP
jgi:hypothetical protein